MDIEKFIPLAKEVFFSLPEYDRLSIQAQNLRLTIMVSDQPFEDINDNPIHDTAGFASYDHKAHRMVVRFYSQVIERLGEEGRKYLIAHEYAHIVLFHVTFLGSMYELYEEDEIEAIRSIIEEQADFHCIVFWGFQAGAIEMARNFGVTTRYLASLLDIQENGD